MTVCLCCHSPMHVCYPEDATRLLETGTGGNFGSVFNQLVNSRAIACPFLFMEFHWKSPPNFQPWPWLPLFPRKKSLLGHIAGACLEWGVRFGWEMAMFDQPELVKKMRCIKRLHMVIYGYIYKLYMVIYGYIWLYVISKWGNNQKNHPGNSVVNGRTQGTVAKPPPAPAGPPLVSLIFLKALHWLNARDIGFSENRGVPKSTDYSSYSLLNSHPIFRQTINMWQFTTVIGAFDSAAARERGRE